MNIDDVQVFTAAVSAGSLAAAARRLGLAPMVASRRLAALEAELGVRLLHRTTRSLSLTPEGETFLPYAQALVDNEQEALVRLRSSDGAAIGLLRVSASIAFGLKFIAPIVPPLLETHPQLRIALELTDTLPDLVASGIDLAIRIAPLRDSGMVAQKLADNPRLVVASPDYLARHGVPDDIDALTRHQCLPLLGVTHWTFVDRGGERHIRLTPRFSASTIEACHATCLAGGGIARLSVWRAADDLAAGRLVPLELGGARPEDIHLWAVYPTNKMVPQKVRVFIAALRRKLAQEGGG
ncbi:LysR family transcriptional regulator [Insolitispirillum peregrinum]|uniref:Transcriptional regulator, LysR family n=1 Tax=Insolitispirillum peregrinum TaxID=80876 RepID=A0A1N7MYG6_9PROT|nr:LysR family transcriptional regulator [Insolitispirillum peregrinum]SIS90991.1 transcriptional regulator, LysR family [Insolitispirillum peregrinum]